MAKMAFVSSTLDRNANNRTNVDFLEAKRRDSNSFVLQLADDAVRLENQGLFTTNDRPDMEAVYLGDDDQGRAWFARSIAADESLVPIRSLMLDGSLPENEVSILAQARSLTHWHARHGFCSMCGAKTLMSDAGYRRHCPSCNADHFPRTDPVVIMAVRHKDKVLLGRQASWPLGMFSALAGFMEPGETIEQAVRREVFEEAGIRVGTVNYVTSQPWPYPSSLMIGMIGEAETTEITVDPKELEAARWFDKVELALMLTGTHPEGLYASRPQAIAHAITKAAMEP